MRRMCHCVCLTVGAGSCSGWSVLGGGGGVRERSYCLGQDWRVDSCFASRAQNSYNHVI